jgi:hypothetical protein
VRYFRPQKTRKTGPRSTTALPPSTQELSQKGGRVKNCKCALFFVSLEGFMPHFQHRTPRCDRDPVWRAASVLLRMGGGFAEK